MASANKYTAAEMAQSRKCIVEVFNRYDQNGDGNISRDEMLSLLRVIDSGGSLPFAGVDAMLSALDRNGDGLVDTEEFVEWVLASHMESALDDVEAKLDNLKACHIFMRPQDEALMERLTLWEVRREENSRLLVDVSLGPLDDPGLLVMSVGSSSTQAYDAQKWAVSFPVGTKVCSADAYKELTATLSGRSSSSKYRQVLLINSIGYQVSVSDPCLVPLSELAARAADNAALANTALLHAALLEALPEATMHVFNRAKDPTTKRYKYAQVVNDFTEALVSGRGLHLCSHAGAAADQVQDAIVDWGGGSFKVYVDGKRIGTELMDANAILCEGNVLRRDRLAKAIREIKIFVLKLLPEARQIFIAQTGKARELAISEELFSGE